ncbi:unnamed protein product [Phytophthora lilii]|uniref:Unnamed protein product n=1 Tax=Phytophthora lilii TaxID=2077276 RepID=A0A9W6THD8_9STRA|nr:unnamed protein product [Phytophthora lilii]
MVSSTSILAMVAAVATSVDYLQAHGYIAKPAPSWKKKETNDWVVEIELQWKGGWDESKGDEGLLATFKELSAANNYKNVRSLMDGNPVYGEDCGFTDPKGTPLDDKMVLQNDDCQSAYGDGTQKTIAVFKPVHYSSCASGGCMLRFYWLALQRLDGKTVWQAYKNCIPLTGPAGGGASQTTPSTGDGSNVSQTSPSTDDGSNVSQTSPSTPSTGDSDSPSGDKGDDKGDDKGGDKGGEKGDSDSPSSKKNDSDSPSTGDSPSTPATPAPESQNTWTQAPSPDTPEMAPAPSSKCNGRRRRRY